MARYMLSGLQNTSLPTTVKYVVNGYCLPHLVRLSNGVTYAAAIQQHPFLFSNRYGNDAVVIFDCISQVLMKVHRRRVSSIFKASPEICFDELTSPNEVNKDLFILMLMVHLLSDDHETYQSDGDADVDIVKTALHLDLSPADTCRCRCW